jgi:shikimate dehydrogenase
MLPALNGATRLHVTIGDPIAQVKSPAGVTQGFAARGADAIMIPLQVKPADIEEFFRLAKNLPNLDGIIITVPHKPVAFGHCDETSERARVLEVCNVMRRTADCRWSGDMTDGGGFVTALKRNGFDPKGKRALQVGAGGAGSAIALSLTMEGASVTLADLDTATRLRLPTSPIRPASS